MGPCLAREDVGPWFGLDLSGHGVTARAKSVHRSVNVARKVHAPQRAPLALCHGIVELFGTYARC
jgi:hypothetical protein